MDVFMRSFPLLLPLILLTGERMVGVEKAAGFYEIDERQKSYCRKLPNPCCTGRKDDECSVERDGGLTRCYCDEFCEVSHASPYQDCCWDYWAICRNTTPVVDRNCYLDGNFYPAGTFFTANCNRCQCVDGGYKMEIMCSYPKKCLVDVDLIIDINRENRGWWAGNVTTFWGRPLEDGLNGLLGTNYSSNKVRTMHPIRTIAQVQSLPSNFDWRCVSFPVVAPIENQNFCNASWVFSIVSTFSDRLAKWTEGRELGPLSYQQLLTCAKGQKRRTICSPGFLTKSWKYIMFSGLTTCDCYPRSTEARCRIPERGLKKRQVVSCPYGGTVGKLYRATALSRIDDKEASIRREIYDNGPVIATMRVFPDFFVYKSGVYTCPRGRPARTGYLHSIKIIGWGIDDRRVPYWIAANSWGTEWGEDGFFKIRRGRNECDIEEFVISFSLETKLRRRRNSRRTSTKVSNNSSVNSPIIF